MIWSRNGSIPRNRSQNLLPGSTKHPERESFYDRHNSFIRCNCRFFYGLTAAGCHFCRAMHIAAIAVMRTCLSVCVSITFVDSVKTNKRIFKIFAPSGSQTILFFFVPNGMATLRREPPNGGIECRWARQKSRFWAYIWLRCVLSMLRPPRCYQHDVAADHCTASSDTYRSGGVSWWQETTTKCLWQDVSTLRQRQQNSAFNCTQWQICSLRN